jgi:hypothetical protein
LAVAALALVLVRDVQAMAMAVEVQEVAPVAVSGPLNFILQISNLMASTGVSPVNYLY